MSESKVDTSRVVVQAYVPAYQRDAWDDHADELGMTRSEYVRTMVQAGRRGFGGDPLELPEDEPDQATADDDTTPAEEPTEGQSSAESADDTKEDALEQRVIDSLRGADVLSWDELLDAVTDDIESQLETTLQRLQAANTVHYSGRKGGYVLIEGDES